MTRTNFMSVIITLSNKTSGEKLPPYLRFPEKAIAYSVAIEVGKQGNSFPLPANYPLNWRSKTFGRSTCLGDPQLL
jgi:hypothetical protein